jgi:uncharacterized protein
MTDDTTSTDYMNYNEIVEQALKGVVRESLERVAENGLPGEHHFYISFLSGFPGVIMPDSLRARYPEEITIVLQHEFWDLEITDIGFSVMLSFNNNREFLNVPWMAITGFADPSVQFGLQFKTVEDGEMEDGNMSTPSMPVEFDEASGQDDNAAHRSETDEDAAPVSADVVELDHFRKK